MLQRAPGDLGFIVKVALEVRCALLAAFFLECVSREKRGVGDNPTRREVRKSEWDLRRAF